MIQNHLVRLLATASARITRTLPTQCNPRHLLPGGISIAIAGSRYPYVMPLFGAFLWEQEMEMFYCQVMQELHELEERTTAPEQQGVVEVEINQYFGE